MNPAMIMYDVFKFCLQGLFIALVGISVINAADKDDPLSSKSTSVRLVNAVETRPLENHQSTFIDKKERAMGAFATFRLFYNIGLQSFLRRFITSHQLGYKKTYDLPSILNTFKNRLLNMYGGGLVRTSYFLAYNAMTSLVYTYCASLPPVISTIGLTGVRMSLTPLEYLATKRIDSVCQWRNQSISHPKSYASLLKAIPLNQLWKGSLPHGMSSLIGWGSFFWNSFHFSKDVKDNGLTPYNVFLYASITATVKSVLQCPFSNIQCYMQQHGDRNLKFVPTIKEMFLLSKGRYFYRGAPLMYALTFLGALPDFAYIGFLQQKNI